MAVIRNWNKPPAVIRAVLGEFITAVLKEIKRTGLLLIYY
jgi:hypothetical protein